MARIKGHRMNFPSLMGAYLAINAIPDAYILVDGPDCALYKAHFIFGRHDLRSTLLNIEGRHRVCFTNVCAQSVTHDHNELIIRRMRMLNELDEAKLVLLTSLPGCSITGLDYDHLVRSVLPLVKKDALAIPPTSLLGDWLDGYAVTMKALAKYVDLSGGKPGKDKAAIVGYFMDRNEGDHVGNIKELKRLLAALGLETVSVWFGGEPYESLGKAKDAGIVVSLPYGREAAAEVARKTGAKLVEAPLPFGMRATELFVRQVAAACGRAERAEAFLEREKREVLERIEWVVPYLFLHKEASFLGDPYLMEGFLDICGDLGVSVKRCFLTSHEGHVTPAPDGPPALFEPDIYNQDVQDFIQHPTELVVSNTNEITRIIRWGEVIIAELGFPSYFHHALSDRPFLGFNGFLSFTERIADFLSALRSAKLMGEDRDDDEEDPDDAWGGMLKSAPAAEASKDSAPVPEGS